MLDSGGRIQQRGDGDKQINFRQALQQFQANQCHESSLCLLSTRLVLPWTLIGLSLADILYVDSPLTT
jgi:hypothetical protein